LHAFDASDAFAFFRFSFSYQRHYCRLLLLILMLAAHATPCCRGYYFAYAAIASRFILPAIFITPPFSIAPPYAAFSLISIFTLFIFRHADAIATSFRRFDRHAATPCLYAADSAALFCHFRHAAIAAAIIFIAAAFAMPAPLNADFHATPRRHATLADILFFMAAIFAAPYMPPPFHSPLSPPFFAAILFRHYYFPPLLPFSLPAADAERFHFLSASPLRFHYLAMPRHCITISCHAAAIFRPRGHAG
jgi:hypothetical protein